MGIGITLTKPTALRVQELIREHPTGSVSAPGVVGSPRVEMLAIDDNPTGNLYPAFIVKGNGDTFRAVANVWVYLFCDTAIGECETDGAIEAGGDVDLLGTYFFTLGIISARNDDDGLPIFLAVGNGCCATIEESTETCFLAFSGSDVFASSGSDEIVWQAC